MNAVLCVENQLPLWRERLMQAGVHVYDANTIDEIATHVSHNGVRIFFLHSGLLHENERAIYDLQRQLSPKTGYFVLVGPLCEDWESQPIDAFLREDCSAMEVRMCVRMARGYLVALEQADELQYELLQRQEEMRETEEYINSTTGQLVSMTAKLQSEILRNQALEAERIKLARIDTILQATATLRHEVNNPLFAITGSAEGAVRLLKREDAESNPVIQTVIQRVERVLKAADRIQMVVEAFAKVVVPTSKDYLPGIPMLELNGNLDPSDEDTLAQAS